MEGRSIGFSLAGVAGVGAIIAALSANQPARASVSSATQSSVAVPKGELVHLRVGTADSIRAEYHHGRSLIEDYARRHVGCAANRVAECHRAASDVRDSLQVVIATIPDPFDSHLDWAYDAYLEALRRSFAAAGYVPDRYWLPGPADSVTVTIPPDAIRRAVHDTTADTLKVALHEYFPGVLLFRSQNPLDHRLALLYLVNELPTTGLHKEAFLAAVRERRLLLNDAASFAVASRVRDTLLIAGPIFSGAAQSLRTSIDDALRFVDPELRAVRTVSGSATNSGNMATLSGLSGTAMLAFQGTLNSDDAMREVLNSSLQTLGLRPKQIAILSESSTLYGAEASGTDFLTITFPLNIASLRNEVGDDTGDAGASAAAIPGLSQSSRTRLELRDQTRPRENPSVASKLTVPTLELMLGEIVQTLAEHEIRAVVIQASDIRDQLLLAHEIRARNRDTQIITFQSHRLLLRPEYATQLNGTLVLTSYPLFLEDQWWDQEQPRGLLTLSNDAAVGTYNAVLTLLDRPRLRIEYESPLTRGIGPATPPVWLTAVANNRFVPISASAASPEAQTYFGSDAGVPNDTHAQLDTNPTTRDSAILSVLGLGVLLLIVCRQVLVERRPIPTGRLPRDPNDETSFTRIETHSLLIHERIYATLLVVAVTDMFVPAAIILLLASSGSLIRIGVWGCTTLALLLIAVGIIDVIRLAIRSMRDGVRYALFNPEWDTDDAHDIHTRSIFRAIFQKGRLAQMRWWGEIVGRTIVALVGMAHLALTLVYAIQLRQLALSDRPRFLLFAYRAERGWSGVSPLLPLILCGAGFALWTGWQWRVTRRLHEETTATEEVALALARSTRGQKTDDPLHRVARCVDATRTALFRIHPTLGGFALTALLVVLGALIFQRHIGSVERIVLAPIFWRWSYDLLFWIGTFSMLVTGAWAVYRIATTWGALQDALAGLSETPLFNAFARLPPHIAKLTRLDVFASSHTASVRRTISDRWHELSRQLEELEHALRVRATPDTLTVSDIEAGSIVLGVLRANAPHGEFSQLAKDVRMRCIRRTACALRDVWRATDTVPKPTGDTPIEQRPAAKAVRDAIRTAEEFMAVECVRYIESVLHDLRRLASYLLVSLLLSVALLSSFPFQPQGIVKLAFIALLLSTVVVLFLVMTQMSRDDVLSQITRSEIGKVSWDTTLVLNVVLFGAIPLLALLSSEFPSVRTFLFSWAEPMVRSIVKV